MEFGQVHHIEYYVNDLSESNKFWDWFLPEMGHEKFQEWGGGVSYRHKSGTYLVFVQVEEAYLKLQNNRQGNGLNHIAFNGKDEVHFKKLLEDLKHRQIKILIEKNDYVCFEDPNHFAVEVYCP